MINGIFTMNDKLTHSENELSCNRVDDSGKLSSVKHMKTIGTAFELIFDTTSLIYVWHMLRWQALELYHAPKHLS